MRIRDKTFDWRTAFVTTLAADVPAAYEGGPSHKAGAPVVLITDGKIGRRRVGFASPSSAALALSTAITAAHQADELRARLTFSPVISPEGPSECISDEATGALYDFFERAYVAIVFSYQAIEAFANDEIDRRASSPMELTLKGKTETLDADATQRLLTTEQKLTDVLAVLIGASEPRKAKWWPGFKELKRFRDATVHLKGGHARPRAGVPVKSYFHELLELASLIVFPSTVISAIGHFTLMKEMPDWLQAAERLAYDR